MANNLLVDGVFINIQNRARSTMYLLSFDEFRAKTGVPLDVLIHIQKAEIAMLQRSHKKYTQLFNNSDSLSRVWQDLLLLIDDIQKEIKVKQLELIKYEKGNW